MKQIGVLRGKAQAADEDDPRARAKDAREHSSTIRRTVLDLLAAQAACFSNELRPGLRQHGIVLAEWNEMSDAQREELGSSIFAA
jgi:polyphosphate kinase